MVPCNVKRKTFNTFPVQKEIKLPPLYTHVDLLQTDRDSNDNHKLKQVYLLVNSTQLPFTA